MDRVKFKYLVEYIWLDGKQELRGKTRIIEKELTLYDDITLDSISKWNYDGSSTSQSDGPNSEVILRPVKLYNNPFNHFIGIKSYIALCDTWNPDGTPHSTNTRIIAEERFNQYPELQPWFGIEQEFFIIDPKTKLPLGFTPDGKAVPQGKYYCSIGASSCYGRNIVNKALENCLISDLNITGLNMEVAPGQSELQIRDVGINAADGLIVLRYILSRTAEEYGYDIDYSAKPVKGDWNGSGCHVNYSTLPMRENGGYQYIISAIERLEKKHKEHLKVYGNDNHQRLTGLHETSSMERFTYGVGNRGASVRIPTETFENKKGYFEDRRPSASMDPYLVTSIIYQTTTTLD